MRGSTWMSTLLPCSRKAEQERVFDQSTRGITCRQALALEMHVVACLTEPASESMLEIKGGGDNCF